MAEKLKRAGEGTVRDPKAWIERAKRIDCRLAFHDRTNIDRGVYSAPHQDGGPGVAFIYSRQPLEALCRTIAHELAHHLLRTMTPESLFGEPRVQRCDDDDPLNVRHDIACEVVRLLFDVRPRERRAPRPQPTGGLFAPSELQDPAQKPGPQTGL